MSLNMEAQKLRGLKADRLVAQRSRSPEVRIRRSKSQKVQRSVGIVVRRFRSHEIQRSGGPEISKPSGQEAQWSVV